MPSTFYALPLALRGESFLLQTGALDAFSILVDAGRELDLTRQTTLAETIAALVPSPVKIDRLVLTHEDADHCEGASQFIEEWTGLGRSIAQAWLPALWLPAAGTGARDGWNISRIVRGAFEAAPEIAQLIEQLAGTDQEGDENREDDTVKEKRDPFDALTRPFRHPGGEIAAAQRASLALDELFHTPGDEIDGAVPDLKRWQEGEGEDRQNVGHAFQCSAINPSTGVCVICAAQASVGNAAMYTQYGELALALSEIAIQTHAKIGAAVAACQAHSIRVRWFDYLLFASRMKALGGDAGFLTPVNAVELVAKRAKASPRTMFLSLFLTRANRESLVFLRHQADDEPAVLFTADSRLKAGRQPFNPPLGLPTGDRLLATAPHHGSQSNAAAYKVMSGWLGSDYPPILVQNGGHGVELGASAFKAIPDHLCVRCIRSAAPPQMVLLDGHSGAWCVPSRHAPCTCP